MKIDMHCHVKEGSVDSRVSLEEYIQILKEKGFQGMVVTDHNTYNGYRQWKYVLKEKYQDDFVVLKGIEYDTRDAGHILVIMPEGVRMRLLELRGLPVAALIDFVHRHGGILHTDDPWVLPHLGKQALCQGHACQLGDIVDNEIRVGSCLAHGVPVGGNCILRQMEVDGRDGGDGVYPQALGMGGQLAAVGSIIAGHVGNDGELTAHLGHHVFQHQLALGYGLVNALSGGAAHIQALHTLAQQVTG